ncbi:MAG: T9SS type A sorting domain-containing protein [Bacteroidia bacterium]|nr:T9SS type A sorting domain-containing protein [Bacteroidia bacterium]
MKYLYLTILLSISILTNAQISNFKVVYSFNSNLSGEIVSGSDALTASNAAYGGSFLKNVRLSADGVQSVLASDVVNNNATNYSNTFIRFDLTSLANNVLTITKISVRHRANIANQDNLFRIGCTKNAATPLNTDINQSSGNFLFATTYNSTSFQPGSAYSTASNPDKLSVFLCARGGLTTTVNWFVDEVVIEGIVTQGGGSDVIVVSDIPKQQMRFGVDAERLWYWNSTNKTKLADLAVKELQSDFVRVAINCAYEREQGVKNPAAYTQILEMMTAMKTSNPNIKFFASERPLDQAYTAAEQVAVFGAEGAVPWAPYPAWIMGFSGFGGVFGSDGFNQYEALQYLADYLNFMNSKGFSIDYLDLTNEKNVITPAITKYMYVNLPALLDVGVQIPVLVVPSSWSRLEGTNWLKSVNISKSENTAFEIAATHNTDDAGTSEDFVAAANTLKKEAWNTELHNWVGISIQEEILTSTVFWEHIRAGFTGLETWLFFGPLNGKDHTMIWANSSQVIKSCKYEIFKKVVNNANRGYYLETSMPNAQCLTASFIKDSILTVFALNKSTSALPNALLFLQNRTILNKSIEVTRWNSKLARSGVVSSFVASNMDNFTYTLDSASLYCFKIDLTKSTSDVKGIKHTNNVVIYPNPTSDIVSISTEYQIDKMEIVDVNGRVSKILKPEDTTISVSDLSSGMYFLRIFSNNYWQFKKLSVVR